jgi:hypothetical protein
MKQGARLCDMQQTTTALCHVSSISNKQLTCCPCAFFILVFIPKFIVIFTKLFVVICRSTDQGMRQAGSKQSA